MKQRLVAIVTLTAALSVLPVAVTASEFGDYWHDGKAELDGYTLKISRYNQDRTGHAVMIYVTEPFSESKRVKVDDHTANPEDTFDALKLNLVRDFQTGIYDYNTMVSLFARSDNFEPVKVTFTSAEWCGHVYSELLFEPNRVRTQYLSYFENESSTGALDRPRGGVSEDNLFILLRGLRGAFLEPGRSVEVPYLPGVLFSRLSHRPLAWENATISRRSGTHKISVPAGDFETIVYTIEAGARNGKFFIEDKYPHRIVRWELSPDIAGELTGSARLAYWRIHDNGDESYLTKLGLPVAAK